MRRRPIWADGTVISSNAPSGSRAGCGSRTLRHDDHRSQARPRRHSADAGHAVDVRAWWWPSTRRSDTRGRRSEQHTSELQSRENLVCRLLPEKKKRRLVPGMAVLAAAADVRDDVDAALRQPGPADR